jgi:hypothetical protein
MATPPDFTAGQVLTAAQMDLIGFWRISGGTALSYDSVFTADYRNYQINFSLTNSTNQPIYLIFRTGGVDNATTNYNNLVQGVQQNGTANNILTTAQTLFTIGYAGNTENLRTSGTLRIMQPQVAQNTHINGIVTTVDSTFNRNMILNVASYFSATTAFDGFKIAPNSGTITGYVQVYGYRD